MCINHVGFNNQYGNLYEQLINMGIFILIMNNISIRAPKIMSDYGLDLDFANHLVLIACFIL